MYIIINKENVVCGNSKEESNDLPEGFKTILLNKDTYLEPKDGKQVVYINNKFEYQDVVRSFSENRSMEYPSITNQLDMIYHDMKKGTTTFLDSIETVKEKYPKS